MRTLLFCLCVSVLAHAVFVDAAALGSAFTNQGQLTDAGVPAHGNYDFQFALHTSATGGNAVDTVEVTALAVSGGLVDAPLDFTAVPYDGQALWLELRVRPAGSVIQRAAAVARYSRNIGTQTGAPSLVASAVCSFL